VSEAAAIAIAIWLQRPPKQTMINGSQPQLETLSKAMVQTDNSHFKA